MGSGWGPSADHEGLLNVRGDHLTPTLGHARIIYMKKGRKDGKGPSGRVVALRCVRKTILGNYNSDPVLWKTPGLHCRDW